MATPHPSPRASQGPAKGGRLLVGAAIILLALNLRVSVTSLGVALESIQRDLGIGATGASILTTLPMICFAGFGLGTAPIIRRVGLHRTTVLSLVAMGVGLLVRVIGDNEYVFFVMSFVALAGAAVGGVALPPLVATHFPDRVGLLSAMYGTALMVGSAISPVLTVPLIEAGDQWRLALGMWAGLAVIALVPWLGLLKHDVKVTGRPAAALDIRRVARSPLTWAMVVCFGAQAGGAYTLFGWFPKMLTDAGSSSAAASIALTMSLLVGIPAALALPWVINRWGESSIVMPVFMGVTTAGGWAGVLVAPTTVPWLWAVLIGLGGTAFVWVLAMVGLRTRTPEGAVGLSAMTQGAGYLIGALMPFLAGLLNDATGSWTVPLSMLVATGVLITVSGAAIARSAPLEQRLDAKANREPDPRAP